jgi:anti-anti-sigma regulatory factor
MDGITRVPFRSRVAGHDEMRGRGGGRERQVVDAHGLATSGWTGTLVNGGLTIEVDRAGAATVLRAHGVLDAYSAPDLRDALLDGIAEQGSGVIVDVSDLTVADDIGLTVLSTVAQLNRSWPGVGIVVAGPSADFTAAVARIGIPTYVPMCPDQAAALAELSRTPAGPVRRDHIAPDRNAPGIARTAVHEFCSAYGVDGNAEAGQLVASELVTNAVVHAGTPIDLTLRLMPGLLHIAVRDTGDGQAKITGLVDESAESGRGLVLVDALSVSWGSFVPPIGKIVWATVRVRTLPQGV